MLKWCVQFLIQGQYCDPAEIDLEGNTALHVACTVGNADVAEYLITTGKSDLKKRNTKGYPPLFCALKQAKDKLVKHIVGRSCVNLHDTDHTLKSEDNECIPLLHFAYCDQWTLMHKHKESHLLDSVCDRCELVKFMIAEGHCDVNQQDSKANTLHFVCKYLDTEMVFFLLNSDDCDLNHANSDDTTSLHLACSSVFISRLVLSVMPRNEPNLIVIKALLDSGRVKNISPQDKDGKTPTNSWL